MKFNELLDSISESDPCGPNLEYDPEYSVLFAKIANRSDVQYGDFVETPDPLNWSEIERECRRLLIRTKDIALLILLARCRTRLAGASGFFESISLLWEIIKKYPEHINPQLEIEGELDIAVRANAMAMLIDSDGLLGDLREMVLSKSAGLRLQVRDVERSFAIPRHIDALAPESVLSQLQDMVFNDNQDILAIIQSLPVVEELIAWAENNLKDYAPDFSPLLKLIKLFDHPDIHAYGAIDQIVDEEDNSENIEADEQEHLMANNEELVPNTGNESILIGGHNRNGHSSDSRIGRKQALESMKTARVWFEQYEPSSPVAVLLKQAEKMVGKRFSDLVQVIPYDLLMSWESGSTEDTIED